MKPLNVFAFAIAMSLASGQAWAQDVTKIVTQADVEKATGLKFKAPTYPMKTQAMFVQDGGDVQLSVDVEPREPTTTVRGWEATMKKMQPATKVETVPGIGKDAIYYSTRPDSGALSADFEQPRVQMRVAVALAKDPAQARQYVLAVAKAVGPRVGK